MEVFEALWRYLVLLQLFLVEPYYSRRFGGYVLNALGGVSETFQGLLVDYLSFVCFVFFQKR